jgi:hypothetical protein
MVCALTVRVMSLVLFVVLSCSTRKITREVARVVRNDPAAPRAPAEPPTPVGASPTVGGCPVFSPDDPWNRDVSNDPVDARSAAYLANIAAHGPRVLHPDFGASARYGLPYVIVPEDQPMVPVTFDEYGDESDPGPYPIPPNAPIERGNDRHVIVVQRHVCKLFELYHARREGARWLAGSGAIFDLRRGTARPRGYTSGDQAGLPIFPGLARYPEVEAGAIRHALRVTFNHTQHAWVAPANHPGGDNDPDAPPMGLRLRLRRDYALDRYRGQTRVILEALQRYGMIVADTGTNGYITGAPDARWDPDDLDQLEQVPITAFEVVASGPLQRR